MPALLMVYMNIWMTKQQAFVYTSWINRIFLLIATHITLAHIYETKKNSSNFAYWKDKSWNLHSAWPLILVGGPFHGRCGGKKMNLFCVASTVSGLHWLVQVIYCNSMELMREWMAGWGCPVLHSIMTSSSVPLHCLLPKHRDHVQSPFAVP